MHSIQLRGARTHNLKGIDLTLNRGELVAVTGPSGAGKSSLALDTLYAEGQRRFVESFSPYARQFLERLERPPMDALDPVSASVAVDRRAPVKSSRSTLATMADLEPYFATLFACEAQPVCPDCNEPAVDRTPEQATDDLLAGTQGRRAVVSYTLPVRDEEDFLGIRETLVQDGYRRLFVGGTLRDIDEVRPSEVTQGVRVEVVVDRMVLATTERQRLREAIDAAWARGAGRATIRAEGETMAPSPPPKTAPASAKASKASKAKTKPRSSAKGASKAKSKTASSKTADESGVRHIAVVRGLVCPSCARGFDPPSPGHFSYNSPLGACSTCRGFGRVIDVDWDKVFPDPSRTLEGGAIQPWTGNSTKWERKELAKYCQRVQIPMNKPWEDLTEAQRSQVIEGEGSFRAGKFPGLRAWFKWLETRAYKMHVRVLLARYRAYSLCTTCQGDRLNPVALQYRVGGLHLAEWHRLTVAEAWTRLQTYVPRNPQGKRVHGALASRLHYLHRVGLGYLTLDRQSRTLSGGEAQRAGLTTALGASLTGTLFVLDEPTVGLHPTDIPSLASVMADLATAGNTVVVVEHDETVVRSCHRAVELGPGAGAHGGQILFDGPPEGMDGRKDLPTGRAWALRSSPSSSPRSPRGHLKVRGARAHNLQGVDVAFPLGVVCAVTGPSGSGKSTLVNDILYRSVARSLGDTSVERPGPHGGITGLSALQEVLYVDQSPLGRTARGNAATYTKAWDSLRAFFAREPEAQRLGFTASHFSFNVEGGRCEACAGHGFETVEMQFLADVSLLCPVCQGKRFKPEVLAVKHRHRSVDEFLAMSVNEVMALFDGKEREEVRLRKALEPLVRIGLGYLPLGQPLSTLSGGEAQRVKLARALATPPKGVLFIVDEPSAGLHAEDTAKVIAALRSLVDEGGSVVVVEHDLDVISSADWIIDLGKGAGPDGGRIVAEGTPATVLRGDGRTAQALRHYWERGALRVRPRPLSQNEVGDSSTSDQSGIRIEHAREHNLKDVSCTIPSGALTVVTGPSGSGKSTLAFDVLFAEGQRRFMETLTPYARQFLPMLPRPDVDDVIGVPPSIALEQRTTRGGAQSTVATVTEVAHYLRLLFAKVAQLHCPSCDAPAASYSAEEIFETLKVSKDRSRKTLYAPAVRGRKGTYGDLFASAARAGVKSARVDGSIVATAPPPKLAKTKEHTIDLIVYYGPLSGLDRSTFDRALAWGDGAVRIGEGAPTGQPNLDATERVYSTTRACLRCGLGIPELDPRWFSFNTKQGQCEDCEGTGIEGGTAAANEGATTPCPTCEGERLSVLPRRARLLGETYGSILRRSVTSFYALCKDWSFEGDRAKVAESPHAELLRRLAFIQEVGLGYLALGRPAQTLSGGEMQRLRLSAQLGSGLTGALYVLDEPTIGLHPRDTSRLLGNLRRLVNTGSSVVVVEHDAEIIQAADHVLDMGPSGGRHGGHIVAQGPGPQVLSSETSPTGLALREAGQEVRPRRDPAEGWITLEGATAHNLRNARLRVPVGRLCVVAGVSGSGKSTLVRHVFFPALRRALGLVGDEPGPYVRLKGHDAVKRAIAVDQSPIGRSPRSIPATFLGIWDPIRKLFAGIPEARTRGYGPPHFSFNTSKGGRCPTCEGHGVLVTEMAFLPDVISPCETCGGTRFDTATQDIRYAGHSIADILRLPADEAVQVFAAHPAIARPLHTMVDLGIGYLAVGQGSNTLSGGEAQRLKLAAELTAGRGHEPTVYVLDEPTTGLHLKDVRRLIAFMERLVDRGDTLVVIEHHPDVILNADWVVELGPEAGEAGGTVVFEGTPEALRKAATATGRYLHKHVH